MKTNLSIISNKFIYRLAKLLVFSSVCLLLVSVHVDAGKYWVQFADKNMNRYSLSNPSEFLSQKAIERRQLQGIPFDEFDLPVSESYIDQVKRPHIKILNVIKWLNGVIVEVEDPAHVKALRSLSFVTSIRDVEVGPKRPVKDKFALEQPVPYIDDNYVAQTSRYDYGKGARQIQQLNGHKVHEMGHDGKDVLVAVIDAGFLNVNTISYFKELFDDNRILDTKDFVSPNNPQIYTSHDHGCMVLSCISTCADGDFVGTAPKAKFVLYRTEDGAQERLIEEHWWVDAAERADSVGADVINSSLGYSEFDVASENHTYQDMDGNTTPAAKGADIAASKGISVVNSAGNSGAPNDPWHYICTPSDGDSVFCIAAVDRNGRRASFSSWGPSSDGDIKPNVAAMGSNSTVVQANGSVGYANGTSFSSPITAGMVACLRGAFPKLNNMVILKAIEESGNQANNPDSSLGYGIPDYEKAYKELDASQIHGLPVHNLGLNNTFTITRNEHNLMINFSQINQNAESFSINIFNPMGKQIFHQNCKMLKGKSVYKVSQKHLAQGLQLVKVTIGKNSFYQKILNTKAVQ